MTTPCTTLPADVARCNGYAGFGEGESDWLPECQTCLRRTAPRSERTTMMEPPKLITFECPYMIEP